MRAEDLLPDGKDTSEFQGVTVRKGSVGAFLANAKALADTGLTAEAHESAQRDIVELLPALRALGLFEIFQVRDETLRAFVESN